MKRLAPFATLALCLVPAAAQAKPQSGALLRVDRAHRKVELVDSRHVVHRYAVAGRLSKKLRAGALVSFKARGKRIAKLRVTGRTRKLAFYATVVSSARKGAVLRLPDGRSWRVGQKQVKHKGAGASSVSISLEGLQPGQVVLITMVSDGAGNVSITIKLVPNGDPTSGEDEDVTGTITAIEAGSVTVETDDQGELTFVADQDLLDGFQVGDDVDVTYFTDGDGSLVADDIELLDDSEGSDFDVVGTVTQVRGDGLTVQVDGEGAMSFGADPDLLNGVTVGELVDVTYYEDADGSMVADDIEPVDDSSGDSTDS
jgi:hypothetical protein